MSKPSPMDAQEQLLSELTDPQRRAVMHRDGPLLVIAAAGSGKTRVITRRVAYLMAGGVEPRSILAITFTNKAAGEMRSRITDASPHPIQDWGRLDQPSPIVCTFHSLGLRILKHYGAKINLPINFSIYDSADQTRALKNAMGQLQLPEDRFTPGVVHSAISAAKNKLIGPRDYASNAGGFFERNVAAVYTKYQAVLAANHAMDFDDLLMRTVELMRAHNDVLSELQCRFQYILIDEYQDTNHAQYILAHALAMKHRNICVVGDPDQSIYSWRGANIRNILDFEKDYSDATVIPLEQNYRSTRNILAIADSLISRNIHRKSKSLWTDNPAGEPAALLKCRDEHTEAIAVADRLESLHREGIDYSGMAVFYRMNSLSRVMEDALRRKGIPYQIARGVEFYNRKEIKDVLAYLRVITNPADQVSLQRIINVPPRALGDGTQKLLEAYALSQGITMYEALRMVGSMGGITKRAANSAGQFAAMMDSLRNDPPESLVKLLDMLVKKSGLDELYAKDDAGAESQRENVDELISAAAEFERRNPQATLGDFLSEVSLVSDADHVEGSGGSVTLMTLHSAKGLEFPVVAIIGMEDGCLPHARAFEDADQLEEERRLCFVGITRARQKLVLSMAARRMVRGITSVTRPSLFLSEMPRELIEAESPPEFAAEDYLPESSEEFQVGQRVRHPAFGIGKVLSVSGGSANRAVVHFEKFGPKILILAHAHLEPA